MPDLILLSAGHMRRISPFFPRSRGLARVDDRRVISGIIIAAGVRFGCVLADAGYGLSAPSRQALTARGLIWSVGVPRTQRVFTPEVGLLLP